MSCVCRMLPEASPEPSVLDPVRASQRAAIEQINRLCSRNASRFAADLKRINLAKMAEGGARKPKRKQRKK